MGDLAATGGGTALAQAGLPRLVELPEGQTVQVRPPVVRDAIELLEALTGALHGDDADAELVDEVAQRWLPAEVIRYLGELPTRQKLDILKGLVFQGANLDAMRRRAASQHARARARGDDPPDHMDWRLALSDYCQIFHAGDPWGVYCSTPFPFFLSMLEVAGAASARDLIRWLEMEVIPHMAKGSQKAIERLQHRATPRPIPEDPYGLTAPPEVIARDREALKREMGARS